MPRLHYPFCFAKFLESSHSKTGFCADFREFNSGRSQGSILSLILNFDSEFES